MAKVAFIGLGVMGYPMAGHLHKAGHSVVVYNRTENKAEKWSAEFGGTYAVTPRAAAHECEFVLACVGNDDDLRAVTVGETGAFAGMDGGSVFIDHTTASANVARELAAHAKQNNIGFVDAPVSGGQAGAENGQLAIMCGGAEDDFARAHLILSAYGKAIKHFGTVGAGQLTKMVNQICITGILQSLSEALVFATAAGLDAKAASDLIAQGAGGSWQLSNRAHTMVDGKYNFGFAVDWMRKDLGIALQTARDLGVALPNAALIDQYYSDVQAMGGGKWDTSALIERLRSLAR